MEAKVRRARPSARLTLKDKLSRLTFIEAAKLLGATLTQKQAGDSDP